MISEQAIRLVLTALFEVEVKDDFGFTLRAQDGEDIDDVVKDALPEVREALASLSSLKQQRRRLKRPHTKPSAQDGYRELVEATNKAFAEAELLVPKYVVDTIRKEGYMLLYNPGKSLEVTSRFSKVGVKLKLKWPKESLRKRAARAHKAIHLETRQELTLLRQWIPLDIVQAIEACEAIKAKAPGTGPYVCRKDKATGEWARLPRE